MPASPASAASLLVSNESLQCVDSSIEPGRSYRHALKLAFGRGEFERVIVAAASNAGRGFDSDDVAWMLDHTSTELLVLKAAPGSREMLLAA